MFTRIAFAEGCATIEIKFDAFLEKARSLGATHVATGHYCRKRENPDGTFSLLEGVDPGKDQSYFLCQLNQEQLEAAVFPIGDLCKSEVRRLAAEADLPSADRKDSQGICFVGKVDLPVFLQQKLASVEGDVVEVYEQYYKDSEKYQRDRALVSKARALGLEGLTEEELIEISTPIRYDSIQFETETYRSGTKHIKKTRYKANPWGVIAGHHEGAQFFTLGQRKGLAIGGHTEPLFVIATDVESNRVYVGEGEQHPGLFRSCIRFPLSSLHWLRPGAVLSEGQIRRFRVRLRYRQELQGATAFVCGQNLFVLFDVPQRSVTPGQFAAFYATAEEASNAIDAEAPELLLSAVIQ